jgi:O-antigen ligase
MRLILRIHPPSSAGRYFPRARFSDGQFRGRFESQSYPFILPESHHGTNVFSIDRLAFYSLWLFVFAIPWEYQVSVALVGTISRLFGALSAVTGLIALCATGRVRLPGSFQLLAATFFGWACMSFAWTVNPEWSLTRIETDCQLLVMIGLVWQFSMETERLQKLLQAYVWGSYVSALSVIAKYVRHKESTDPGRYTAGGFGPNELAITLAWTVPVAWILVRGQGKTKGSWIHLLHFPVIALAVLLTASRGGAITLMVTMLAIPLSFLSATQTLRSRWLLPLGVAAVCVVSIVPSSTWQRLATTRVEVESKGVSNRQVIWTAGLGVFGDGNQLLGIGSGTYATKMASVLGREAVAHNSFISILVETGLVGSTLFALLLSGLCLGVARMQGWTKVTWMIVMAGWIVGVLSMTGEGLKATWLLFSFISAASDRDVRA